MDGTEYFGETAVQPRDHIFWNFFTNIIPAAEKQRFESLVVCLTYLTRGLSNAAIMS